MNQLNKTLVSYSNGPLHLGHVKDYIQLDIAKAYNQLSSSEQLSLMEYTSYSGSSASVDLKSIRPLIDIEYFRYYYASKTNKNNLRNIYLFADEFKFRINADLIGKYINVINRLNPFLHLLETCNHNYWFTDEGIIVINSMQKYTIDVFEQYEVLNYKGIIQILLKTIKSLNVFINSLKPWNLIKDSKETLKLINGLIFIIYIFQVITILLSPIMPVLTNKLAKEVFNLERGFNKTDLVKPILLINPNTIKLNRVTDT